MRKEELERYQKYAKELLEVVRKRQSYGEDLSGVKELLRAFLQALKEGDSFQADYLLQLINSALENGENNFSFKKLEGRVEKKEEIERGRRQSGWIKSYGTKEARLPPSLSSLIIFLVILLFLSSLGIASAGSFPDSSLYPLKRGAEKVKEWMVFSSSGKAYFELSLAKERLREAKEMKKRKKEKLAQKALEEMKEYIEKGKIWADISNSLELKKRILKEESELLKEAQELNLKNVKNQNVKVEKEKKKVFMSKREVKGEKDEKEKREGKEKKIVEEVRKTSHKVKLKGGKKGFPSKGKSKKK